MFPILFRSMIGPGEHAAITEVILYVNLKKIFNLHFAAKRFTVHDVSFTILIYIPPFYLFFA